MIHTTICLPSLCSILICSQYVNRCFRKGPSSGLCKKKNTENALVMYFWAVYLNISFFLRRKSFQMNKSGMMWRSFMKEYLSFFSFFFWNAFITSGTGVSCLDNNAEFDVLGTCMIEWRWYYVGKPGGFNDGSCDVCVLTELSSWQQLSNDLHSFFPPIIPFLMLWATCFAFSAVIGQTVCCKTKTKKIKVYVWYNKGRPQSSGVCRCPHCPEERANQAT